MGSCVSYPKGAPDSSTKLGVSFGSKEEKLVIPESPIKEKPAAVNPPLKTIPDYGSKEETFFDSQPFLDSDCDDDFFSVNGDFTPSRGNTPVHNNFPAGTPRVINKPTQPGSTPEPSPGGKKKRLSELFQDSLKEDNQDVDTKSANSTPFISGANSVCSSERTPNGDAVFDKEKYIKSVQCCIPSFVSCRSFGSRRKKRMASPAVAINGAA